MEINKDLSIIVSCGDQSLEIFDNYVYLKDLFWSDCPFNLYLVTPTNKYDREGINSIVTTSTTNWAERVATVAKMVDTPYILTMCEDAYICKQIDTNYILSIIKFMKDNNIKYYNCPKYELKKNKKNRVEGFDGAVKIKKKKAYGVTAFLNIWKKEEFINLFGGKNFTAWDIENYFLEKASENEKGYYEDYLSDQKDYLNVIEAVNHGCWTRDMKYFNKHNIKIDYGDRKMMSRLGYLRERFHRSLNKVIPIGLRKPIKRFLSKLGFKYVTRG